MEDTLHFHFHSQPTKRKDTVVDAGYKERAKRSKMWKSKTRLPTDYKEARNRDSLLTPFECDICIFSKLQGSDPEWSAQRDLFLLDLIRGANLDAFWSRAQSTVQQNLTKVKLLLEFSNNVGLPGPFAS